MPVSWGGKDDYEFSFVPEKRLNADDIKQGNGDVKPENVEHQANNNDAEQENLNLLHKKVS